MRQYQAAGLRPKTGRIALAYADFEARAARSGARRRSLSANACTTGVTAGQPVSGEAFMTVARSSRSKTSRCGVTTPAKRTFA
jgi:hypothetical protein